MRNSIARIVLPQPGPPQISVGRPFGSPPPVISSSPRMPVGDLGTSRTGPGRAVFRLRIEILHHMEGYERRTRRVVGLQRIHVAGVFSQAGKQVPSEVWSPASIARRSETSLSRNMGGGTVRGHLRVSR